MSAALLHLQPAKPPVSAEAQDAARWAAFREMCSKPWNNLSEGWQDFFYLMGDDQKCAAGALDAAIDKAMGGK